MPTEELESILYRDFSKVVAKDMIDIASPLLREIVNYGTNAFARCIGDVDAPATEAFVVPMLYLHIIEMIDGVEVLAAQGCGIPAIPLVRSAFEGLIFIEYILQAHTTQRSRAWLVDYARTRLSNYEMADPKTERGRQHEQHRQLDSSGNIEMPPIELVRASMKPLQRLLARPELNAISTSFKGRNKRWYNLGSGPRNIEQLAGQVGRPAQYDILYRSWASIGHVEDISRFLTADVHGMPAIKRLRNPEQLRTVVMSAASISLSATRQLIERFRPGEDLRPWYIQNVQTKFRALRDE